MYLIIALLIGAVIGFSRKGSLKALAGRLPSLWYLGLAGAVLEMFLHFYYLMPSVGFIDSVVPVLNFAGYLLILTMLTFNLDDAWTVSMGIGLSLNFIATFINGGFFPVSEDILLSMSPTSRLVESIYVGANAFYTVIVPGETLFSWLCVIIPIPFLTGLPALTGTVAGVSVGDLLLFIGAGGWVQRMMTSGAAPERAPRKSRVYKEPQAQIPQGQELYFEEQYLAAGTYTAPAEEKAVFAEAPAGNARTEGFAESIYGTAAWAAPEPEPVREEPPSPVAPEEEPFVPEAPVREEPEQEALAETGFPAREESEAEAAPQEETAQEAFVPEEEPTDEAFIPEEETAEIPPEPEEETEEAAEEEIPEPEEPTRTAIVLPQLSEVVEEESAEPAEAGRDEFGFPVVAAGFPPAGQEEGLIPKEETAEEVFVPEEESAQIPPEPEEERNEDAVRLAQQSYSRVFENTYRVWRRMRAVSRPRGGPGRLVVAGSAIMEVKVKRRGFIIAAGQENEAAGAVSEEEMLAVWERFTAETKQAVSRNRKAAEPEPEREPEPPERREEPEEERPAPESEPERKPAPARKRRKIEIID